MTRCSVISCRNRDKGELDVESKVVYHGLPTCVETRKKWKEIVTKVNGCVPKACVFVCSEHFLPQFYSKAGRLMYKAVPTVFDCVLSKVKSEPDSPTSDREDVCDPSNSVKMNTHPIIRCSSPTEDRLSPVEELKVCSTQVEIKQPAPYLTPQKRTEVPASFQIPTCGRKTHIGDLKVKDFSTPEQASKHLDLITKTVAKYRSTIRKQQRQIKWLRKKVETMEDLSKQK